MLVIVAPGQGAQSPGFLTPWLEDPVFASRFDWLATVAGIDLAHYGTEADAEAIRDASRGQLAAYKVPRRVVRLDELPKSLIGKVLRREVRDRLIAAG